MDVSNITRRGLILSAMALSACQTTTTGLGDVQRSQGAPSGYSSYTSLDQRNEIHCNLYNNGLGNLVFPNNSFAAPRSSSGHPPPQQPPSFGLVHAFADLQGDGVLENITRISNTDIPRSYLPMYIWPQNKSSVSGSDNYGMGGQIGIKIDSLEVSQVLVDDLNGDSVDDLVFVEYGEHDYENHQNLMGGTIYVALSSGAGGRYIVKGLRVPKNSWHRGVTLDYDLDGDKDIMITGNSWPARQGQPWTYVLVNDGAGGFRSRTFSNGGGRHVWAIGAGDVDGDGIADIFLGRSSDNGLDGGDKSLTIYWGGDGYRSGQKVPVNLPSDAVITDINYGDLDSDGDSDLVLLVSYNDYAENLILGLELEGRQAVQQRVIYSSPRSSTGGRFWGMSYVYVCNGDVLGYYNRRNTRWLNVGGL